MFKFFCFICSLFLFSGCSSLNKNKSTKREVSSNQLSDIRYIHHDDLVFNYKNYFMNDDIRELVQVVPSEILKFFEDNNYDFRGLKKESEVRKKSRISTYRKYMNDRITLALGKATFFYQDNFIPFEYLDKLDYSKNYWESYLDLLYVNSVKFDKLSQHPDYVNDTGIKQLILDNLNRVSLPEVVAPMPAIEEFDQNGSIISSSWIYRYSNNNDENEIELTNYFRKIRLILSPLFIWLVDQPISSVSHSQLFLKATELYGNPVVAIAAIAHLLEQDVLEVPRSKYALASSKLIPCMTPSPDTYGENYHFWGFLLRSIFQDSLRSNTLSKIYEGWIQKDYGDRASDMLGVYIGKVIKDNVNSLLNTERY